MDPKGILMATSDGCSGIIAAIRSVFPYSEHQPCLFHKMANLKAKCPKSEWSLVKAKLGKIYYAPNLMEAKAQAQSFSEEYQGILPGLHEPSAHSVETPQNHQHHR